MLSNVNIFCFVVLGLATCSFAGNVLINDDFEAGGGSLANWTPINGAGLYTYSSGADYSTSPSNAAVIPKSSGTLTLRNPLPLASQQYTSVTIVFNHKWNNGATTRFLRTRYASNGVDFVELGAVTSSSGNPVSYTITKGSYTFTDQAKFQFFYSDGGGNSYVYVDNVVITGTPTWMPRPTGLTAEAGPALGSVRLDWVASSNAVGYNVKRSLTNSAYATIGSTLNTSFLDLNVKYLTNYYYVVSATNAFFEGENSDGVMINLPVRGTVISVR